MSIDVIGTRVLLDNLDKLLPEVKAAIAPVMQEAAAVGEQVMKANARVDTGEMRDSTYVDVRDDQIVFGDDSDHALYNELGTSKMSAQPFIVPGAVAGGDYLMQNLSGIL
jgi:HK97 gp10 family phage protein